LAKIHKICAAAPPLRPWIGLVTGVAAVIGACGTAVDEVTATAGEEPPLECGDAGYLSAELFGGIEARLEWDHTDLACAGMPRPEGNGARLRLAGTRAGGGDNLVFIVAIPDLRRDTQRAELEGNVTVIEEGKGRFFSTPDFGNCIVAVRSVTPLDESGERFAVAGSVYCVDPVPEVNGTSAVSIPELHFSGLLDWSAS
jgi:hypothetical protein